MADNTLQNGTATVATDDIGGVHYQRVKNGYGPDGTYTDVAVGTPMPTMRPDTTATGTITATDAVLGTHAGAGAPLTGTPTAGSYVAYPVNGEGGFTLRLSGTFGGGTVWMESSVDSTDGINGGWTTNLVRQSGISTTFIDADITAPGIFRGTAAGYSYLRVRITGATTPSVTVAFRGSQAPSVTAQVAALPPGTNTIGRVGDNTDGALRTRVAITYTATAPPTTDALLTTLTLNKGGTVTANQTSIAATSGKVLRIVKAMVSTRATVATLPYGALSLRINEAGAAVIGSPLVDVVPVSGSAAVIGNTGVSQSTVEDGIEISGTQQLALSYSGNLATNVVTVSLVGFEYTA